MSLVSHNDAYCGAADSGTAQYAEWLAEAKRGSDVALGKLLAAAHRYLLSIANQTVSTSLRSKLSPSDLVQETALEAYKDFASFDGQRFDELLAWLRQILLNNSANMNRRFERTLKRQVDREVSLHGRYSNGAEVTDPGPSPSKCLDAFERQRAIELALDRLPPDMRAAVVLRNREHLSFAEIGVQLERSAEAARKLWARAIERLQKELI